MNLNSVRNLASRVMLKLRKVSPELALAGGIACGVGAVVVGCIASRHVDDIIGETRAELDDLQERVEEGVIENPKKEAFGIYSKAAWKFTKLYAPTVCLTMTSVGLTMASHGILSKRYVGLSATYSALDGAFKDYRRRVRESLGEDAERILAGGGVVENNIRVVDENGNVENKKGNNLVIKKHKNSPYEFDFNRFTAKNVWEPSAEMNDLRLRNAQSYFNDLFNARGHVFLNEVLDYLGMARTPEGAICGWVKGAGDDYIDFGYWDSFKRDYEIDSDLCVKNIHLNFNCDGVIYDMI